jgi:hypothetical protein
MKLRTSGGVDACDRVEVSGFQWSQDETVGSNLFSRETKNHASQPSTTGVTTTEPGAQNDVAPLWWTP